MLLAPTLLLFAASFLVLRLLLFVFHRMDRRIGRSKRVSDLPGGPQARAALPGAGFAAALLLLLAMGLLVVSTSYRAIVLRNHEDAAHTIVGADWNIQVSPPDDVLPAIDDMPPNTTPVVRTEPDLGAGTYALPPTALAIDPATYADGWMVAIGLLRDADRPDPGRVDVRALGLPAPRGRVDPEHLPRRAGKAAAGIGVTATVIDDDGVTHTPEPQPVSAGTGTYRISLDAGHAAALHHVPRRHAAGPAVPLPDRDLPGRRRRHAALAWRTGSR